MMADTKIFITACIHCQYDHILVPLHRSAPLIVIHIFFKIVCGDIIYEKNVKNVNTFVVMIVRAVEYPAG
jgi:hypothetical protein